MTAISLSRRLRQTPFSHGVEAMGVKGYTVYNHMLLPTVFEDVVYDYHHLKQHVQVWDVACERQVEIRGKDAAKLVQLLTPRDLSKMQEDQCYYIPVVDDQGGMLNDPVALRPDEDRWWISIADSDLKFWIKGLAYGMGLDVHVHEPDVSPLAIQGPKSEDLLSRVMGDQIRDIRFFRYKKCEFQGKHFVVARSGYSKQGGFEIYVEGSENGMDLWNALFEAGKDLNIRPGCPNLIERIESGLLSYGNDMTMDNNPFECGLGKFCNAPEEVEYIGKAALDKVKSEGAKQHITPLAISGEAIASVVAPWPIVHENQQIGQVTSATWSPDFKTNVSIGMVDTTFHQTGASYQVHSPTGMREVCLQEQFWV